MAAIHVLRYLWGKLDFGQEYVRGDGVRFAGYTGSDWVGSASLGKLLQGVALGWFRQLCCGSVESKTLWH